MAALYLTTMLLVLPVDGIGVGYYWALFGRALRLEMENATHGMEDSLPVLVLLRRIEMAFYQAAQQQSLRAASTIVQRRQIIADTSNRAGQKFITMLYHPTIPAEGSSPATRPNSPVQQPHHSIQQKYPAILSLSQRKSRPDWH
ncbi:hypothetical protein Nepgr_021042 [Nepenthes gracilis]|uniref:Uncharacterized protein n=1 Tax=Nepenthes gracilis TaxID=150966 RepID=A0AAD3XWZ5_NEPGR|nr:hypothetical protein Nepgr_021042 [Nepenthes gracilis]